jgi:hypothetical protein
MIALVTPTISVNEHMFGPALVFRMQIRVFDTEFIAQSNRPSDCEHISCSLGVNPAFYLHADSRSRGTRDAHRHSLEATSTCVIAISPKWNTDLTLMMAFFARVIKIQATKWERKKLLSTLDLHLLRDLNRLEIVDQTRTPPGEITTTPDIARLRFAVEDNTEGGHDERGICPQSS